MLFFTTMKLSHTHIYTSVVQVSEMASNCYWVSGRFFDLITAILRKSEDWFAYVTVNLNKPKTHLQAYGYLSNLSSNPWVLWVFEITRNWMFFSVLGGSHGSHFFVRTICFGFWGRFWESPWFLFFFSNFPFWELPQFSNLKKKSGYAIFSFNKSYIISNHRLSKGGLS